MTEAVEFEVPSAGAPILDGQEGPGQAPPVEELAAAVPVPGWTQQEAARVIGGLVSGLTTAMYVIRYQAPPAAELVPHIAGDPEREFPLLGMSLAPILDLVAPKGSPAAIGVGLGAGVSEVMTAMARRGGVLNSPPPKARAADAAAEPAAAAPPDGQGFRYRGDLLRVLQHDEAVLTGTGIE